MPKIKDLPTFDRPREKLKNKGPQALRKQELLAIILRTGTKGKSAIQIAQNILSKYGGKKLINIYHQELSNIHGVGPSKASQIIAAIELGKRLYKEKIEKEIYINSPKDIAREVNYIKENKKENFVVLYLDARNKLITKETISIGSLNANIVHPREVFEPAITHFAASVILAHNHPSGDTEPSEDDIKITKQLTQAGKIMGIEVLDHIIISKDSFLSFKEKGLLSNT